MCGRFAMFGSWDEVFSLLGGRGIAGTRLPARYNIAPTTQIPILRAVVGAGERTWEAGEASWGIKPDWAKSLLINAKAEKIVEPGRSFWKGGWQRCLIPASGFFEWKRVGGDKVACFIHNVDGSPLLFAGLVRSWANQGEEPEDAAIIITTGPNALMKRIHSRMPAIIRPADALLWLGGEVGAAHGLLVPDDSLPLEAYAVGPKVGSVRNDGPELVERLDEE